MTPGEIASWWQAAVAPLHSHEVETAAVLLLDGDDNLVGHVVESSGSRHAVVVPVQEGLRKALIVGAHSVVMVHNHPGDDPSPSVEDMTLTRELRSVCRILRLTFKDSVILAGEKLFSFEESGWMEIPRAIEARTAGELGHQALGGVINWMEAGHPGITSVIVEAAALEDLSPEQWLGNLIIEELRSRFGPAD